MSRDNEDLVADSEDEEVLQPKSASSSIQDCTANKSIMPSNISAFTSNQQASTSAIVSTNETTLPPAVRPRPRPRPVYKGTSNAAPSIERVPGPQTISSINDFSSINMSLTIADRAKSRTRKPTQPPVPIANVINDSIIDIPSSSDSEDQLQLLPPSRSKSNPKSRVGDSTKSMHIIEIPDTQPTLPVPTSDIHPLPPGTSSQLPPSDLISTPESVRNQKSREKIVSPESSPLPFVRARKRKRPDKKMHNEDEAAYGSDDSGKAQEPIKRKVKKPRASGKKAKGKGKATQRCSENESPSRIASILDGDVGNRISEHPVEKDEPKDDEGEEEVRKLESSVEEAKENSRPVGDERRPPTPKPKAPPTSTVETHAASSFARLNYRHSIASETKPTSMSDLIRKVNSIPGSPHPSSSGTRTYSPLLKSSRSALRKIAPLHPNRRTPPPLPPKPPAPKKTKKQLQMEEKWEEELEDSIEGWACLTTEERDLLRKAKRDKEMGWED